MPKSEKKSKQTKKRIYTNGFCKYGKYWWICIKINGKKIERSTKKTTIEEAAVFLADLRKSHSPSDKADNAPPIPIAKEDRSLLKAVRLWHGNIQGVSARYKEQMLEIVEIHMNDFNHLHVGSINTSIITAAVKKYITTDGIKTLKGKTYSVKHSNGGANRLLSLLSALYTWILDDLEWIECMPWRKKMLRTQKTSKPVVFNERVQEFLSEVNNSTSKPIIRLAIMMQLGLGLRETETSTADWMWFTQRNKTYNPGLTKNSDTRCIPVPDWLFNALHEEWLRQGKPSHGLILRYKDGTHPVYRGFTRNATASAGNKLGLHGLHPHRLRASFATSHFEEGTKLSSLMEMMGHSHEATTRRYIVRRKQDAAEAQDKVASAMGF